MADGEQTLNFKITTNAELGGFEAVASSLEKQIGMAKALGKDYTALAEQLKTVRQSIEEYNEAQRAQSAAANDVIEVTKEDIAAAEADAAATEEQTISKMELREAIHGLGLEFPELDRLVHVATSSIGLAFASVSAAVGIWVERIRDLRAETDGLEFPDVAQTIKPIQDAATAWNGLADAIQRASDNYNSAESSANRAIAAINSQLAQQKELLAQEKQLALAKLESQKSSMSLEEYAKERGEIESAFGQADVAADEKARRARETTKANEAANLDVKAKAEARAAGRLPQASPQTEKMDEDALKAALEDRNKKIEEQTKLVEAGRTKLQEAQDTKDSLKAGEYGAALHSFAAFGWDQLPDIFKGYGTDDPNKVQQFREDQLKTLTDQRDNLQGELERRQSRIKQRDELRHAASGDEEKAQGIRMDLADDQKSDVVANKVEEHVQSIKQQTDQIGQHIDQMGKATAKGLESLGNITQNHSQRLQSIEANLSQQKDLNHRLTNQANGPY